MARVTGFSKESVGKSRRHPTEVECGYSVVHASGQKLLQLNTYGSQTRAVPGKLSQTLQLDEAQAQELVAIVEATFPGREAK